MRYAPQWGREEEVKSFFSDQQQFLSLVKRAALWLQACESSTDPGPSR